MNFDLKRDAFARTLITAHRGVWGGNIPCNTLDAFEVALAQGADMIELDVAHSADGELFVFHPGMEKAHLGSERAIADMRAEEVRKLHFHNYDQTLTQARINTFDEALEALKGRCYINVDKFWENIEPVTKAIRRHAMENQILVKTGPKEDVFRRIAEVAPDIAYMLILRDRDEYSERMLSIPLNYVGAEILFTSEDAPIASREYVETMHQKGLIVWANAIVYNYRDVLSAGHNDDISVTGHPEQGWGWLLDQGYNILQTDWPGMLRAYMQTRNA